MAEFEPSIGLSSDCTHRPRSSTRSVSRSISTRVRQGLGTARKIYTEANDGLNQPWEGLVFMNPSFGGRNGHVPWLRRFLEGTFTEGLELDLKTVSRR